jgi:hypothetical protein
MSEQIQAGDGWRLLGPDEVVFPLDERYFAEDGSWHQMSPQKFLCKANLWTAVRRRIPAKPEAMVVDDSNGQLATSAALSDCCLVQIGGGRGGETIVLSGTQEIRQLADWLNRYADWREAQEGEFK